MRHQGELFDVGLSRGNFWDAMISRENKFSKDKMH